MQNYHVILLNYHILMWKLSCENVNVHVITWNWHVISLKILCYNMIITRPDFFLRMAAMCFRSMWQCLCSWHFVHFHHKNCTLNCPDCSSFANSITFRLYRGNLLSAYYASFTSPRADFTINILNIVCSRPSFQKHHFFCRPASEMWLERLCDDSMRCYLENETHCTPVMASPC